MKTIIAGSRTVTNIKFLESAIIDSKFLITSIVSGGAYGVDRLGEIYATKNNIPLIIILAEWHIYGKKAGMIRNTKMAKESDALIALWDGQSKGTKNMIETAKKLKLDVYVCII